MKKAVAILCVFTLIFLVSCKDGSDTDSTTESTLAQSITEKIIESVTQNELCSVPTAPDGFELMSDTHDGFQYVIESYVTSDYIEGTKNIYGDDKEFIQDLLKGIWSDYDEDCLPDAEIHCMGTYYYSSCCGTVKDGKGMTMHLTKSQVHRMNEIIGKYRTTVTETDLSRSILSKDGMKLNVELSKNPVKPGEKFVLTVTVENNSGRTVYIHTPTGTPDMHYEVRVKISDGKYSFVDLDTQGKCYTCDMGMMTLKDGETYTQQMNMAAGYYVDGSMLEVSGEPLIAFGSGTYKGTATVYWNFDEPDGEHKSMELEFNVDVK